MSATRQPRVRDRRPGQAARSWVGRNVTRRQSQAGQQPAHVAEPRARGRRDLGPDVDQGRTHCSVVAAASSGASRLARSRPERSLLAAIPALICDPSQQWRTWNSEGRYRPSRLSAVLVVTLARVGWPCRISRPSGAQISSVTGSERNGQHRFSGCDEQPLRFPAGAGSVSSPGESSRPGHGRMVPDTGGTARKSIGPAGATGSNLLDRRSARCRLGQCTSLAAPPLVPHPSH
jgi:hypothetical protein